MNLITIDDLTRFKAEKVEWEYDPEQGKIYCSVKGEFLDSTSNKLDPPLRCTLDHQKVHTDNLPEILAPVYYSLQEKRKRMNGVQEPSYFFPVPF
ncbi:TPA: hypothetical protein HA242_06560 [Candidatus Woesearchaeota archaeon]|nr:hypothetical protein [Candidatus Woesearchaeota archaeon]HIG93067.1 hypothetical protein [Candidatus Woesearchaeota archaeon]HIH13357.1 hypothetical protein [Candidatus Woesearchaeota archaeon]